jgi:hypothetical protein
MIIFMFPLLETQMSDTQRTDYIMNHLPENKNGNTFIPEQKQEVKDIDDMKG